MDRYVNFLHAEINNKTLLEHLMDHEYLEEVNSILRSLAMKDSVDNNLINALKKFINTEQQLYYMLQK